VRALFAVAAYFTIHTLYASRYQLRKIDFLIDKSLKVEDMLLYTAIHYVCTIIMVTVNFADLSIKPYKN
jgi:hypothetical protein